MTFAMVCPCAPPPISVRRIIMSKVPLSISLLDWFFLSIRLSTRSSMERDNIPLGLLWEETCESTHAAIGQLATTGQCTHRARSRETISPHKRTSQRQFSKTSALGDSSRHADFPRPLVEILYFATNGEPFLAGQKGRMSLR